MNIFAGNGHYICELLPQHRCLKELVTGTNYSFYDRKNDCQFRLQLTHATHQCMRRDALNSVVVGECSNSWNTLFSYEDKKLRNGNLCVKERDSDNFLIVGDCHTAPTFELLVSQNEQYRIKFVASQSCIHVHHAEILTPNQPLVKYLNCGEAPQTLFKVIF